MDSYNTIHFDVNKTKQHSGWLSWDVAGVGGGVVVGVGGALVVGLGGGGSGG